MLRAEASSLGRLCTAALVAHLSLMGCSQPPPEHSVLGAMIAKSREGYVLSGSSEGGIDECQYASRWDGRVRDTCRVVMTLLDGTTVFFETNGASAVSGANDELCASGDDIIRGFRSALENSVMVRGSHVLSHEERSAVVDDVLLAIVAGLQLQPSSQVCDVYFGLTADGVQSDISVDGNPVTGMESRGVWARRQSSHLWRDGIAFPPRNAAEASRYQLLVGGVNTDAGAPAAASAGRDLGGYWVTQSSECEGSDSGTAFDRSGEFVAPDIASGRWSLSGSTVSVEWGAYAGGEMVAAHGAGRAVGQIQWLADDRIVIDWDLWGVQALVRCPA